MYTHTHNMSCERSFGQNRPCVCVCVCVCVCIYYMYMYVCVCVCVSVYIGEGNGNPLQYSFLENPMDRGVWRATVHGITRVGHDLATKPPPCMSVYRKGHKLTLEQEN